MRYQTFGYLEPNVKSMIIIVIFTHRKIWVGCIILLHYLMYIIMLQKFKMMLMCSCTTFFIQTCNNVIFLSWKVVNFRNKSILFMFLNESFDKEFLEFQVLESTLF